MDEFEFKVWLNSRIEHLNNMVKTKTGEEKILIEGQLMALSGIKEGINQGNFD